jgi:hypothetical protein
MCCDPNQSPAATSKKGARNLPASGIEPATCPHQLDGIEVQCDMRLSVGLQPSCDCLLRLLSWLRIRIFLPLRIRDVCAIARSHMCHH